MDPTFSPEHARAIAEDLRILTEGYAVQDGMTQWGPRNDYWWVCEQCARDFAEEFKWTLLHVV